MHTTTWVVVLAVAVTSGCGGGGDDECVPSEGFFGKGATYCEVPCVSWTNLVRPGSLGTGRFDLNPDYTVSPPRAVIAVGQGFHASLLIGHLDTVFEPDHPFQRFERRTGNVAHGPGIADMKGGGVAVLYRLAALDSVGALEDTTITVALTGDEERPGRPLEQARAGLVEAAQRSDVALGFETSSRDDDGRHYATIARRSSSGWKLVVDGRQGHSSGIFRGNELSP